jgi:hypothetical protein
MQVEVKGYDVYEMIELNGDMEGCVEIKTPYAEFLVVDSLSFLSTVAKQDVAELQQKLNGEIK